MLVGRADRETELREVVLERRERRPRRRPDAREQPGLVDPVGRDLGRTEGLRSPACGARSDLHGERNGGLEDGERPRPFVGTRDDEVLLAEMKTVNRLGEQSHDVGDDVDGGALGLELPTDLRTVVRPESVPPRPYSRPDPPDPLSAPYDLRRHAPAGTASCTSRCEASVFGTGAGKRLSLKQVLSPARSRSRTACGSVSPSARRSGSSARSTSNCSSRGPT
jgi:hypothetical protein